MSAFADSQKRQATFNTIGTAVTLFCQWLIMMLIPKITNFSDAGIFSVAISICSILNMIATFSMNQYQVSDQYEFYSEGDYFLCRVITVTISFLLCPVFILLFNYSLEQGLVIIIYMLYRNFIHLAYLYTATLQIQNRLDYVGKCMIYEGIISLVSFILSFIIMHDLVISVTLMAILGGGSFLLMTAFGYRRLLGKKYSYKPYDKKKMTPMLSLGFFLLISFLAPTIITAIPKIALQYYWGDELVGIFSTLSAPTIIVPTLVTGVFTPFIVHFSNLNKTGQYEAIHHDYLKTVAYIIVFGIACLIVSLLFAEFFFKLLYGEQIVEYVWYFHFLIIGITFYSIGMCGIIVLMTKNQGRPAAIASMVALMISAAIMLATVPAYGIDAATFGLMTSYAIFSIVISACVIIVR